MDTIRRMRRLIIIFMLVMLPLQVSWAAIAAYCNHETGAAAQHLGHHEHQHHAQDSQPEKEAPSSQFDGDCGFCQFSGIGWMSISPSPALSHAAPEATVNRFDANLLSSFRPDRPERPKWVRAA